MAKFRDKIRKGKLELSDDEGLKNYFFTDAKNFFKKQVCLCSQCYDCTVYLAKKNRYNTLKSQKT